MEGEADAQPDPEKKGEADGDTEEDDQIKAEDLVLCGLCCVGWNEEEITDLCVVDLAGKAAKCVGDRLILVVGAFELIEGCCFEVIQEFGLFGGEPVSEGAGGFGGHSVGGNARCSEEKQWCFFSFGLCKAEIKKDIGVDRDGV